MKNESRPGIYQETLMKTGSRIRSFEQLKNKKILITGASGMIGSCLVDLLLYWNRWFDMSVSIYAAGRDTGRLMKRFPVTGAKGNQLCCVPYEMDEVCRFDFDADYIIHAAGDATPQAFMRDPVLTVRNSVESTYRLLEYGQKCGARRFLYISSGEVYGQAQPGMRGFAEEYQGYIDPLSPRSCYPLSKRACENICAGWSTVQAGPETIIARLCHIYGPTASLEDGRAASLFLRKALSGENIVLKSPGEQQRSWCYVCDCASALLTILLNGENGRAYNVADRNSKASVREFAELTARQSGNKVVFDLPDEKEKQIFNPMDMAVLETDKLEELGWEAAYPLAAGIFHTLQTDVNRSREDIK